METVGRMRKRVLDNLTTTFASNYTRKVTLDEMLEKDAVLQYRQMKTGEKLSGGAERVTACCTRFPPSLGGAQATKQTRAVTLCHPGLARSLARGSQ